MEGGRGGDGEVGKRKSGREGGSEQVRREMRMERQSWQREQHY